MPVELRKTGPVVTEADITAFETRIGHSLPSDYRTFLIAYNGGKPNNHVIRNSETGDIGVQIFFGVRNEQYYDIDAEIQTMQDRVVSGHLSIAIDGFGNRFCLSLRPPDFGRVYFWNHEEEAEEDEGPAVLNLYRVADSFAELWQRMEPIDAETYLAEKDAELARAQQSRLPKHPPKSHTNGDAP